MTAPPSIGLPAEVETAAQDSELLRWICSEHWQEIHHTESQRESSTTHVIAFAAAILGIIANANFHGPLLTLGPVLFGVGILGWLASRKYHERVCFSQTRLDQWYKTLDQLHPHARFLESRQKALAVHQDHHPIWVVNLKLNQLWSTVHLLIVAAGLAIMVVWNPHGALAIGGGTLLAVLIGRRCLQRPGRKTV